MVHEWSSLSIKYWINERNKERKKSESKGIEAPLVLKYEKNLAVSKVYLWSYLEKIFSFYSLNQRIKFSLIQLNKF